MWSCSIDSGSAGEVAVLASPGAGRGALALVPSLEGKVAAAVEVALAFGELAGALSGAGFALRCRAGGGLGLGAGSTGRADGTGCAVAPDSSAASVAAVSTARVIPLLAVDSVVTEPAAPVASSIAGPSSPPIVSPGSKRARASGNGSGANGVPGDSCGVRSVETGSRTARQSRAATAAPMPQRNGILGDFRRSWRDRPSTAWSTAESGSGCGSCCQSACSARSCFFCSVLP